MCVRIMLNGSDWRIKGFIGDDWIWRDSEKPDTKDIRGWNNGTVPGSIQNDLWKAGEIPDPYYELNSLLIEWIPQRTWLYKKSFNISDQYKHKRIHLHFKGVDYEGQFFLNGEKLGQHKGMYTPVVFDVTNKLKFDQVNLLAIAIEHAPDEQPQVGKTEKVWTHKSRMTYWWDFCPRMIHLGIWDDVFLEITGDVCIEDIYVQPVLKEDLDQADITVYSKLHSDDRREIEIETKLLFQEKVIDNKISRLTLPPGITTIDTLFPVKNPLLWWPNGYGDQNLYTAMITVMDKRKNSEPSDTRKVQFGIRRVEMVANETEDSTAKFYTFKVNGQEMYIKGWNWVPIDVMYGTDRPRKLERLLQLVKRANVNMLRVWGGGLIEKDAFYALCDQLGIMVWQEFIQSSSGISNKTSGESTFIRMMAEEAEKIIPLKRNHPSLVLWCGGNELMDDQGKPLDDNDAVLTVLKEAVNTLDPYRAWLPTSPSGRLANNNMKNIQEDPAGMHDIHGPWEHQGLIKQYTLYNHGKSLFHSEFGVEGMTNMKTLHTCISKKNQWPATKDNPVWFHRGSWWINEPFIQEAFGGIDDIDTLNKASQFLQAEGLKYAIEANRRRKYVNSGSIPWQFNEPYPNGYCTCAVDYYAIPKPAYYAVANAYKPICVHAVFSRQAWGDATKFETSIWASNSKLHRINNCRLYVKIAGTSGWVYKSIDCEVIIEGNKATMLSEFSMPLKVIKEDIFFLDLKLVGEGTEELAHNRYIFSKTCDLSPMLTIEKTKIKVRKIIEGDQWKLEITNDGDHAALMVQIDDAGSVYIEDYAYFSDNWFSLLPGESRRVEVLWSNIGDTPQSLELKGWNTEQVIVDKKGGVLKNEYK
jgi:beta-mannosidase